MDGYQALREACAWLDLSDRGRIRAAGEDRVRLLHAMCTNHIQQLRDGQGCYAFFLNPQGHILADAAILALPDALLIDTEPETRESLYAHLDKYIIADDVSLEDVTAETVAIGVEGPAAAGIAGRLGAPLPAEAYAHEPWGNRRVIRCSVTGQPGFMVVAPAAEREALVQAVETAGAVRASAQDARVVRLEQGRPRYGEDIGERHLPQETQSFGALHFSKGCYIGQEIVERIRSRGGVHRFLTPLAIEVEQPPDAGAPITLDGKTVGEITSAVWSPGRREVVALGYLRPAEIPQGARLTCAGREVRVATSRSAGGPAAG